MVTLWKKNKKENYSKLRKESEWKVVLKQQAIYIGSLAAFYGIYFFLLITGIHSTIALYVWGMDTGMYWFIVDNLPLILVVIPLLLFMVMEIRMVVRKEKTINQLILAIESVYNKDIEEVLLPSNLSVAQDQLSKIQLQQKIDEQRAKEAEQKKNDLIVYLAHDLKTPLTSIIGYLSLLDEEEGISKKLQQKYQGIALDKAYRLEDLINEFFEITRYNLQTMELDKKNINLRVLLEQLIDEFYPIIKEKKQEIDFNSPKEVFLEVDGFKIARVLDNVLKNAYSYGDENSTIQLSVEEKLDAVIICIKNQGPVIPNQKLHTIFDKFYRIDESRSSETGGSGLGLAVAKRIVELHDGTISAESAKEGTSFIITLPKPE